MILGAFLAGALFSFVFREREQIMEKLNSIGQGFFIPFFFVVVGVSFDPRVALTHTSPFFFLSLLGLGLIQKIFPSLWLPADFGAGIFVLCSFYFNGGNCRDRASAQAFERGATFFASTSCGG